MKGNFYSIWSDGSKIVTPAILIKKTGEVSTKSVSADPKALLVREFFETPKGNELEICMTCHEYILKTVMNPGIGHDLNEETECSNPECESRA